MRDFRKLLVWQKAHEIALAIYRATAGFPRTEIHGLVSQMRRAALSIAANIAEGCGRESEAELGRFLHIAMGSASELEYELLLAHELGFISPDDNARLSQSIEEVKRMLTAFSRKLTADS